MSPDSPIDQWVIDPELWSSFGSSSRLRIPVVCDITIRSDFSLCSLVATSIFYPCSNHTHFWLVFYDRFLIRLLISAQLLLLSFRPRLIYCLELLIQNIYVTHLFMIFLWLLIFFEKQWLMRRAQSAVYQNLRHTSLLWLKWELIKDP